MKYPAHYYDMSAAELKYLGLEKTAGGQVRTIEKKRKYETSRRKEQQKKRDIVPVEPPIIDETGDVIPSLSELQERYREKFDFWELAGFQEKQLEAAQAVLEHKYVLYGGAAGGGKSYFLRWMALFMLMYYSQKYSVQGVRVGLFCEDYPALKERHLSKVEFEFPSWLGELNKSEAEFRLKPEFGAGIIAFRNLDDPSKYLSSEFASVLVDEITRDTKEVFNFLVMRMRWKGITSEDNKFIAASNPGGPGHGWVKGLWINRDFRDFPRLDPRDVKYVKALFSDNKYIDPAYGDQLSMLPEDMARAYRDGDWDIFAGKYFIEFIRDVHVIEPFTDPETIKQFNELPIWVGLDYGYTNPSAVVFGRFWDETWYIFDEIYVKGHTYEELRDAILAKGYPVELIFADPAIWAKKDSPTSGADKMQPLPMRQAMNERLIGWTIVREAMKQNQLKIFNTCSNLVRTIPDMIHHEKKVEDLDTNAEDHAVDALRYLLFSYKNIIQQQDVLTYTRKTVQTESDIQEVFGDEQRPALYNLGFITSPFYNGK